MAPTAPATPPGCISEAQIQRAIIDLLTKAGVFCFSVPNNPKGRRTVGFKAGIPDVWAVHDGKVFALELKTEKGGVVSEKQLEAVSAINEAGGFAAVANGLDKAIAFCEAWGLLRRGA